MKKVLAVIMTVILLMSCMAMFASAQDKVDFLVLGDSIAEGIGAVSTSQSYSYTVARDKGYELHNIAKSGKRSDQLVKEVQYDDEVRDYIAEADIINISIGGNDFLQGNLFELIWKCICGDYSRANEIMDDFSDNYETIITEIRILNPDAQIIAQTLYNPIWWFAGLGGIYENVLTTLNANYYTYSESDPLFCVLEVHDDFDQRVGLISFDFIHPSQFGHNRIARLFEAKLTELGL